MRTSLSTLAALAALLFFNSIRAHTVQLAYCHRCCQLVIYAEHWHGVQGPTGDLVVQAVVNGQTRTETLPVFFQHMGVPLGQLPCSDSISVISTCTGQANTYNDFWEYRFPNINCGDTVTLTVLSGLTTGSQDGCSMMPASSIQFIACANSKPHPTINAADTVCQNWPATLGGTSTNSFSGITSWSWDIMNDGTIDYTTQNASHTFTSTGTFPVKLFVQDSAGCRDSVIHQITVEACTGIGELATTSLKMYPNPADKQLWIELGSVPETATYAEILSIDGKRVHQSCVQEGSNNIDVGWLTPGYYAVVITTGGTPLAREKLVIK